MIIPAINAAKILLSDISNKSFHKKFSNICSDLLHPPYINIYGTRLNTLRLHISITDCAMTECAAAPSKAQPHTYNRSLLILLFHRDFSAATFGVTDEINAGGKIREPDFQSVDSKHATAFRRDNIPAVNNDIILPDSSNGINSGTA